MRKRTRILSILFSIAAVLVMVNHLYIVFTAAKIKTAAWEYLAERGYGSEDIVQMEVSHSYLSKILSYGEWAVRIVYADEPTATYSHAYSKKEDTLKSAIVSGTGGGAIDANGRQQYLHRKEKPLSEAG